MCAKSVLEIEILEIVNLFYIFACDVVQTIQYIFGSGKK